MNSNGFAKGYSKYKYFLVFVAGCIFGFIYETMLCLIVNGYIESKQGLIFGPFAPVYGVGAVIYMYFLKDKKNVLGIFAYSAILGGIVEFIYSFLQELYFGTVSWDYSNYFMNFQGRTSILHAAFWGIIGVLFVKVIYPFLSDLIEKIPNAVGIYASFFLAVFLAFDIYFSILVAFRQNERIMGLEPQNALEEYIDDKYNDEKLKEIYPGNIRPNRIKINVSRMGNS